MLELHHRSLRLVIGFFGAGAGLACSGDLKKVVIAGCYIFVSL
jgi:hypothetical protein